MRAFTSLAGHILGSHPQINGYYEMHLSYENASALGRQLDMYRASDALKPDSRYLFDKLLHNDFVLQPARLGLADSKILIALAEPERTIQSMVHLFAQKPDPDLYASPVEAARYYVERVQALAGFSQAAPQRYFYFDAGLWQRAPAQLLSRLADWLELDSPLSERYETFSHTGKAGKGDSSPRIHGGRIDTGRVDYSHINIPGDALRAAQAAYRICRTRLIADATDSITL
ncbi:MAG: hypothetical protein B7X93_11265 [Hydrogenophilales bacterium 17-61-9]|nr:MAG: hypothetical protein B7X93_11265 [Hydrogenophilales bacterium 17-61-9]